MKRYSKSVIIGVILLVIVCGVSATVMADGTPTESVNYKELIEYLPDVPSGWEGEEPDGMSLSVEGGSWSWATGIYSKSGTEADVTVDVVITDYAANIFGWQGAWESLFEWESTEGHMKRTTVNGFPAWEVYTKDTNDYALTVGINDRFLVLITTNDGKDTLYEFANLIDYDGISSLSSGVMPTKKPDTSPEATEETSGEIEADEEPGFEAVFAISGFLAVAYLVRKRR